MKFKRLISLVLLMSVVISSASFLGYEAEAAYTPPYSVIKVGINSPLRSSRPAVPNVTLSNSSGFNIGTYDSNRNFSQTGSTSSATLKVDATSGTVKVTDSSGNTLATSSKLAIMPKSNSGTSYSLPSTSYGKSYSYYGGFEFICSGGTMTVVNYVDIETYVIGVVPNEMPASWSTEALKAQALCARTYAVSHFNTYSSYGFDVCNTTSSQVYYGVYSNGTYLSKVTAAVNDTAGQYILHNGSLISAYFHASSGGATENSENVWSATLGYLKGKYDTYETTPSLYTFSGTFTQAEILSKMKAKDSSFGLSDVNKIEYTTTAMGNIYSVTFTDSSGKTKTYLKESARTKVLGAFTSYTSQRFSFSTSTSSLFGDTDNSEEEVELDDVFKEKYEEGEGVQIITEAVGETNEFEGQVDLDAEAKEGLTTNSIELNATKTYTFTSRGYGHNVGMSQYGAKGMAEAGYSYDQIIKFYYTDVTISDSNGSSNGTPFTDIGTDKWYFEAVKFVYDSGLFNGTTGTTFEPEGSMTRGQLVTVLGRMYGIDISSYSYKGTITANPNVNFRTSPDSKISSNKISVLTNGETVTIIGRVSGSATDDGNTTWYQVIYNGTTGYVHSKYVSAGSGTFSDVKAGDYYAAYIQWAAQAGIVDGYDSSRFGPDDPATREQVCVFIMRYANYTGKSLPENVDLMTFNDRGKISNWAIDSVDALQKAGVIDGVGDNTFAPASSCLRAQVAQILMKYITL